MSEIAELRGMIPALAFRPTLEIVTAWTKVVRLYELLFTEMRAEYRRYKADASGSPRARFAVQVVWNRRMNEISPPYEDLRQWGEALGFTSTSGLSFDESHILWERLRRSSAPAVRVQRILDILGKMEETLAAAYAVAGTDIRRLDYETLGRALRGHIRGFVDFTGIKLASDAGDPMIRSIRSWIFGPLNPEVEVPATLSNAESTEILRFQASWNAALGFCDESEIESSSSPSEPIPVAQTRNSNIPCPEPRHSRSAAVLPPIVSFSISEASNFSRYMEGSSLSTYRSLEREDNRSIHSRSNLAWEDSSDESDN